MRSLSRSLCVLLCFSVVNAAYAESEDLRKSLKRLRSPAAKRAASKFLAAEKELAKKFNEQVSKLYATLNSELEGALQESTASKDFKELQRILDARKVLEESGEGIIPAPEHNAGQLLARIAKLERQLEEQKNQHSKPVVKKKIPASAKPFNGHVYFIFDRKVTRHHASLLCEQLGGYLVRIESSEENDFIKQYILSQEAPASYYWVDGSDAFEEGAWVFNDGKPMTYFNWSVKEPNNYAREHAICLTKRSGWDWGDYDASSRIQYICEWD